MNWQNVYRILKSDYLKLLPIMALAFYLTFIPHHNYPYPVHLDDWIHMAHSNEIISEGTVIGLTDPFTGEGMSGNQVFETGFHLLWAIFHEVTDISWLTIFKYFPSIIFVFTVLSVYILGRKHGFGWEAAFFTSLIPTTIGILGPGFLVPIAMGLLFIPITIYLAFNYRTVWSYLALFVLIAFMVTMHPPSAICLVLILIPFIVLSLKGNFKYSLILVLIIGFLFLLPFPWIFDQLLPTVKSLLQPRSVLTHVSLPRIIEVYGYLPVISCLLGTFILSLKPERRNLGLVLGLFLLLAMLATFYTLHYGQVFVYYRGLMVAMLMMSIVAGAGLHWVRDLKLPERLVNRIKAPLITRNVGYVLCLIFIGITLYLAIPVRQNIYYYHMIDEENYQAFVWVKDNIDASYEKAILNPLKAVPFTAVTGRYTYGAMFGAPTSDSGKANQFLRGGCTDTDFLKENGISIVYTRGECNNPDLVEVRDDIYLLKDRFSEQ